MTTNTTPAVERLGRFGHHPDAAIDYECEIDALIGMAYERLTMGGHPDLEDRISKAMDFRSLQTPGELRWLNQVFLGAREIYARKPDWVAWPEERLASLASPAPVSEPVAGSGEAVDREARRLYIAETANDPAMHCNRFPSWEEMSDAAKEPYRLRAAVVCDERGAEEQEGFGLNRAAQNYFRARNAVRKLSLSERPVPAETDRSSLAANPNADEVGEVAAQDAGEVERLRLIARSIKTRMATACDWTRAGKGHVKVRTADWHVLMEIAEIARAALGEKARRRI